MTITKLKHTLELVTLGQISDFNLAQTTVGGHRLFEMGNITRSKMPQLKGFPRKGSVAELLPKDKNGKVDVTDQFLNYLANQVGLTLVEEKMEARSLRGSQAELVASKVAKHAIKMLLDPSHKKLAMTYIVSKDGTLVDGHHGWAAVRCFEALTRSNVELNVLRVKCDIHPLIEYARCFTRVIGIENKDSV